MAEADFLERRTVRPGSAAAVILIHGAAIAALLMAKGYVPAPPGFVDTRVKSITLEPPPPPEPVPPDRPRPREQRTEWTAPQIPRQTPTDFTVPDRPVVPVPDLGSQAGTEDIRGVPEVPRSDPPPLPTPVRIEAQLVSGDLQPSYPASEQRMEREGTVVIRVTVGANGRVIATEKVRATSDAFYEATERHARARWRFRPATVDGRPIEARKTLTVVFRLDS